MFSIENSSQNFHTGILFTGVTPSGSQASTGVGILEQDNVVHNIALMLLKRSDLKSLKQGLSIDTMLLASVSMLVHHYSSLLHFIKQGSDKQDVVELLLTMKRDYKASRLLNWSENFQGY